MPHARHELSFRKEFNPHTLFTPSRQWRVGTLYCPVAQTFGSGINGVGLAVGTAVGTTVGCGVGAGVLALRFFQYASSRSSDAFVIGSLSLLISINVGSFVGLREGLIVGARENTL